MPFHGSTSSLRLSSSLPPSNPAIELWSTSLRTSFDRLYCYCHLFIYLFKYNVTGESLTDDSCGLDTPIPKRLYESKYGYVFRRNAKKAGEEPIGAASLRLHEIKSKERGEKKGLVVLKEKNEVINVGFTPKLIEELLDHKKKDKSDVKKGGGIGDKISAMLAPIRSIKYVPPLAGEVISYTSATSHLK